MCGSLANSAEPVALRAGETAQLLLADTRAPVVAKRTAGGSNGDSQRSPRDLLDRATVETVEVWIHEPAQCVGRDSGVNRLDEQLLEVLLGLGETDVGHDLDCQQGVGESPGLGAMPDQQELEWPSAAREDLVDAS